MINKNLANKFSTQFFFSLYESDVLSLMVDSLSLGWGMIYAIVSMLLLGPWVALLLLRCFTTLLLIVRLFSFFSTATKHEWRLKITRCSFESQTALRLVGAEIQKTRALINLIKFECHCEFQPHHKLMGPQVVRVWWSKREELVKFLLKQPQKAKKCSRKEKEEKCSCEFDPDKITAKYTPSNEAIACSKFEF